MDCGRQERAWISRVQWQRLNIQTYTFWLTRFLAKPDVTLTISDGDLVDLMTGKLNSQKAFFQGKLKVQGNMGLAMKLQEFQKKAPKSKL